MAPRPFPDEAMGSWLGRMAARYRVPVASLLGEERIESAAPVTNVGWLLAPVLSDPAVERLAFRARFPESRIRALQTPESWLVDRRRLGYCATCLFPNRRDVTAPYWKHDWLAQDASMCREHGPLDTVSASRIRRCPHFGQVVRTISHLRASTRHLERLAGR